MTSWQRLVERLFHWPLFLPSGRKEKMNDIGSGGEE